MLASLNRNSEFRLAGGECLCDIIFYFRKTEVTNTGSWSQSWNINL